MIIKLTRSKLELISYECSCKTHIAIMVRISNKETGDEVQEMKFRNWR